MMLPRKLGLALMAMLIFGVLTGTSEDIHGIDEKELKHECEELEDREKKEKEKKEHDALAGAMKKKEEEKALELKKRKEQEEVEKAKKRMEEEKEKKRMEEEKEKKRVEEEKEKKRMEEEKEKNRVAQLSLKERMEEDAKKKKQQEDIEHRRQDEEAKARAAKEAGIAASKKAEQAEAAKEAAANKLKHDADEAAKAKEQSQKERHQQLVAALEAAEKEEKATRKEAEKKQDEARDGAQDAKAKTEKKKAIEAELKELKAAKKKDPKKIEKKEAELLAATKEMENAMSNEKPKVKEAREAADRHAAAEQKEKIARAALEAFEGKPAAQAGSIAKKGPSEQQKAAEKAHQEEMQRQAELQKQHMLEEQRKQQQAGREYPLTLKNIFVSHGKLSPDFSPDNHQYTLKLEKPHDELAITPEIFKDRPEYQGGEINRPRIEIKWDGNTDKVVAEVTSVAVRRQIDLPDDADDVDIEIRVINPINSEKYLTYHVKVEQPSGMLTVLKGLEATDETGASVQINPIPSQDAAVYTAYVTPNARTLNVKADCLGSWMTIDGSSASRNQAISVVRDLNRHVQVVEVTCGVGGNYWKDQKSNTYFLRVISDFAAEDLALPRLVIDTVGQECQLKNDQLVCPDPRGEGHKTRLIGFIDPQIRYTVESSDNDVQVRVLNQIPSVPFTYRSDLKLVATGGRNTREWPLHFDVPFAGAWMKVVGWLLGFLLALLLSSLVLVLGLTSMLGIGLPFGVTEVASTLTLLLQYFCFSDAIRGHGLLNHMTDSLKWVTLFWPLPWGTSDGEKYVLGNVEDINNAYGCLWWAMTIFLFTVLLHVGVMLKFIILERGFTFPHRLVFGGLEARCIHWLLFPAVTAASMILVTSGTPVLWAVMAGLTIAVASIWAAVSWFLVKKAVDDGKAVWVWNTSLREDGALEDESGFWSDAVCDQLNTEPANRSLCPSYFQWKWSSTVGDIDPVHISPETFNRRGDETGEDESSRFSLARHSLRHDRVFTGTQSYPMAKHPKIVEVYQTRAPGICCPGQRLMVGLLRMQWLDTIMTYQGLTRFHAQVVRGGGDVFVPLVVKTHQVQGSLVGGRHSFFFDGVRLPFVKICDSIARIVLGVCVGIALASQNNKVDAAMFGLAAVLSTACLAYFASTCPYSRRAENWLYGMVMLAISLSAWSFVGYAATDRQPSTLSDIFLWVTAIIAVLLAAYSCMVTFSLFSAVFCAPLEETRFIETLSNCTVCLADHQEGWAVGMPGYCNYPIRDFKVHCNATSGKSHAVSIYASGEEPTYEFSVEDFKTACRSSTLRAPVLCLYATSCNQLNRLGYDHINIYDKDHVEKAVIDFLTSDPLTRSVATEVATVVSRQIAIRRDKAVISVTVMSPKHHSPDGSAGKGYDWSSSGSSTSASRTGSSRSITGGSSSSYTSVSQSSKSSQTGASSSSRSRQSRRRRDGTHSSESIEMSRR